MEKFKLDGIEYDFSELNDNGKHFATKVQTIIARIDEANNMMAILTKAKRAYIADLKSEMLSAKSGFDFGDD